MGDVAKDLLSGTVGGAAQLICGHPFDTIKVKLQSQPAPLPGQAPKYAGAIDAVRQTIAAEGPGGLYKGMGAPLATVAAFNAVLFTVRGQMETILRSQPGAPLTVNQQFVAGAGAGVAVSFLACPTELIKCRLQAQSALAADAGAATLAVKYTGPMDVAKQVLKSEGGVGGLFKGLTPTMAREIPGNAAMFGVYEAVKQFIAGGQDTSQLGRGSLIIAGGVGGACFWGAVYPTDVVKSVLQVDDYKNPKYSVFKAEGHWSTAGICSWPRAMTHASSMQFSPKLRVHNYLGCSNVHTSVVGKSRLCKDHVSLSSHSMRQDAWSLHLLSCASGPIHPASSRCNVFLCQSVLVPGGGNDINVLKSAAAVLTKSYNALRGNPVVLHLIPAAGIIAFTAWGLLPLIRLGRVIILNRTDSSWKKSKTHYVLSTYIQPLLLWFGATLICRALDPVILPTEASQAVKQRVLNFIRSLSTVLAFAYCLSSLIQEVQKFYVETQNSNSSETRNMGFDFAGKAIYTAVWVAAVSLFMELLGFSTQKWLTAGGLGTVLLTLAGREIFTNFLSSVMIQATRPFVLNEWIQTKIDGYEVSGTVEHVGWWSPTIIRGDDREAVHIPNHKFTVNVVRNLSQKTHWRIKTHLAISHLDAHKINNIVADMRKVLAKNPQVEQQKLHRRVFLDNVNPENQALMILISCFVKTSHFEEYLCVKEAVILDLLRIISHHRARLATPIRTVQKFYREPDLENIPFSDTIFSRSTAPTATNSSLLLIEPSYKISADDKVKSSTRPVKDTKTEGSLTPDSEADSESGTVAALDPKENKVKSTSSTANTSTKATVNGNEQQQNVKIVDAIKKAGAVNPEDKSRVAAAAAVEKSPVTNSDTNLEKTDNPSVISQTKQDMDRSFASQDKNQVAAADEKYPVPNSDLSPEKTDNPSAVSQTKQEMDRSVTSQSTGRSSLEENIVLGVALEGSRRTLPIEEETTPTITAESKGLAASRNGNNGSPAAGKETKDGNQSD